MSRKKIRIYGLQSEYAFTVATNLLGYLYEKFRVGSLNPEVDGKLMDSILEIFNEETDAVFAIILATMTYCIGNFDRFEKIEHDADLDENGQIVKDSLREVELDYVL